MSKETEVNVFVEELVLNQLEKFDILTNNVVGDKTLFNDYGLGYINLSNILYEVDKKYDFQNDDYIHFDENGDITFNQLVEQIVNNLN